MLYNLMRKTWSQQATEASLGPQVAWEYSPGWTVIESYCVHRRDSRLEPPLAHSLNHLGICPHALSLHVRKSTQGEAEYTTCLTSSGDIQNHLFLAVLGTQLKIFLIKKNNKMPSKRCLHFYLNLALLTYYHIKGRISHLQELMDILPRRDRRVWVVCLIQEYILLFELSQSDSPTISLDDNDTMLSNIIFNFSKPFNAYFIWPQKKSWKRQVGESINYINYHLF